MARLASLNHILRFFLAPFVAFAADGASASTTVALSDRDLVTLIKGAIWVGGIFIAVFAFFSVTFFGIDVRKARAALLDAQKETRALLDELNVDFAAMKDLKEKLEQLGAQLEDSAEPPSKSYPLTESVDSSSRELASTMRTVRTDLELIREVIKSSAYDWTTIGRLVKRSGLSRDAILEEIRRAPDIQISTCRTTQDYIFKLKVDF
ncbi:hypothetical protein [Cupriavidus sp. CuC1]|uniref:hypothetical protein n=1 Tax=Cupriavidus sp. CuC1 TaxID=3373131 RepID=UPI0037D6B469